MTNLSSQLIFNSLGGIIDNLFLAVPRMITPFKDGRDINRETYEKQISYYFDAGYIDNPASFFTLPEKVPAYKIIERKPYHDGEYQLISYNSGYTTKNPHIRDNYNSYEANRTGYLVRWTHGDGNRKTVLCHHGYMLGEPRQARKMFGVKSLFTQGLDVALFIAPFHWKRSTGSWKQRGIYLQPDDVVMTCECIGQTQHDLYSAFLILSDTGTPEIGLIGASLGGYNTALFACLTSAVSFAAMMVPAMNFSKPFGPDKAKLPFAVDETFSRRIQLVWEMHAPVHFTPKIPAERMLVVASLGDKICPFEYVQPLCDKWGITDRHFITGGHWLVFNRSERGRSWYALLAKMGFINPVK